MRTTVASIVILRTRVEPTGCSPLDVVHRHRMQNIAVPLGGRYPASSPQPRGGVPHPGQGAGVAARGRVTDPVLPGAGPTRLCGDEAASSGALESLLLLEQLPFPPPFPGPLPDWLPRQGLIALWFLTKRGGDHLGESAGAGKSASRLLGCSSGMVTWLLRTQRAARRSPCGSRRERNGCDLR